MQCPSSRDATTCNGRSSDLLSKMGKRLPGLMMPVASVCPSKMTYSCGTVADSHRFPFLIMGVMNLLRLQTYIKISDFMPVLLKKSIRTSSAEYESLIVPGYSQGFKPMPR